MEDQWKLSYKIVREIVEGVRGIFSGDYPTILRMP